MVDLVQAKEVQTPLQYASSVIHHENDARLVAFYHAALGSPSVSTFLHATDKFFLNGLPGLTSVKIRRNAPIAIATSKGHLVQSKKSSL
mmetsp:Transcript_8044/g.11315  ORF Transcript_8044/g.11315 Transcript_8044/m.11315 type:complete len:89 (-) Transcript_8044:114-380(-)